MNGVPIKHTVRVSNDKRLSEFVTAKGYRYVHHHSRRVRLMEANQRHNG
jgi:hypothetical protein